MYLDGEDALGGRGFEVLSNVVQEHRLLRKVDVRLPGKGNSNSHGARPVHLTITMIKWIRASRLSIKNSLYRLPPPHLREASNRLFEDLDLCWRSPESGDAWYSSVLLEKMI